MLCPRDGVRMIASQHTEREVIGQFVAECIISTRDCPRCGIIFKAVIPVLKEEEKQ